MANLDAAPIAALWLMPLEVLVLVLMPFGLEGTVTPLLGGGVVAILWIAATVSAWPFAAITLPAPGPVPMLMMVAGGFWLALWQRRWRLAGVVAIALGLTGAGPVSQPDILIAEEARLVGLRSGGDVLHLSNPQAQPFVRDVWQRRTEADLTQAFPPPGQGNGTLRCDGQGCIGQIGEHRVAVVRDPLAFAEDCRNADIVVAEFPAPRFCDGRRVVVDWFDLWRCGAHAIWLGRGVTPVQIWRSRPDVPTRPWMRAATR